MVSAGHDDKSILLLRPGAASCTENTRWGVYGASPTFDPVGKERKRNRGVVGTWREGRGKGGQSTRKGARPDASLQTLLCEELASNNRERAA